MTSTSPRWPYPRLIAHRGAGKLAPENTLAAMRCGAQHGYSMFEYDVKLSKDKVAILHHDECLDRTSNATGPVTDYSLAELHQFDFGGWHSPEFYGEPILTLCGMANFSLPLSLYSNIEIKPSQGLEAETGALVARQAQTLWAQASLPPLLSSFSIPCLEAAALGAPELPRALLIEQELPTTAIIEQLHRLGCVGVNIDHQLIHADLVRTCQQHNFFITAWTVNTATEIGALFDLGVDAIITDAVDQPFL